MNDAQDKYNVVPELEGLRDAFKVRQAEHSADGDDLNGYLAGEIAGVAQNALDTIAALTEALEAAVAVTDGCCGCIVFAKDEDQWERLRDGSPIEVLNTPTARSALARMEE